MKVTLTLGQLRKLVKEEASDIRLRRRSEYAELGPYMKAQLDKEEYGPFAEFVQRKFGVHLSECKPTDLFLIEDMDEWLEAFDAEVFDDDPDERDRDYYNWLVTQGEPNPDEY